MTPDPATRARAIAEDELRSRMIRVARLVHGERWNDFGCWHGDLLSCGPCSRVAAALTEPPGCVVCGDVVLRPACAKHMEFVAGYGKESSDG